MAQKHIGTSGDVVTYLTAQHEAIKALFIETLDASNAEDQQEAFTRLRTLLAVHETAEEMMVHPRVRRKIDGGQVRDYLGQSRRVPVPTEGRQQ